MLYKYLRKSYCDKTSERQLIFEAKNVAKP